MEFTSLYHLQYLDQNIHIWILARLRFDDGLVSLEYARGDLYRARLEAERSFGVAWLEFQFQQYPDVISEFEGLVQHVLSFDIPFSDCEYVVECHFLCDRVRVADDVGERVLDFVGRRNLLPGGKEHTLVELTVFGEQYVSRYEAREVKHVHVILYRYLWAELCLRTLKIYTNSCEYLYGLC